MVYYERELQENSTESKIIEFDSDFAEKLKIEVRGDFENQKNEINENKMKLSQNY